MRYKSRFESRRYCPYDHPSECFLSKRKPGSQLQLTHQQSIFSNCSIPPFIPLQQGTSVSHCFLRCESLPGLFSIPWRRCLCDAHMLPWYNPCRVRSTSDPHRNDRKSSGEVVEEGEGGDGDGGVGCASGFDSTWLTALLNNEIELGMGDRSVDCGLCGLFRA